MNRRLAAPLAAVLMAVSAVASAEVGAGRTPDASTPGSEPDATPWRGPAPFVRPILLVGLGGDEHGGLVAGADLGLRVERLVLRGAWRMDFTRDAGWFALATARAGWIFAERRWVAGFVSLGAGRLSYDSGLASGSWSTTVFTGGLGALLGGRERFGPAVAVELEALWPRSRAEGPPDVAMAAPALLVTASVHAFALGSRLQAW